MKKVSDMEERTEYLENKSRQNNVRIFNIPEKSEGNSMIAFLKNFLTRCLKSQETLILSECTISTEKVKIRSDR